MLKRIREVLGVAVFMTVTTNVVAHFGFGLDLDQPAMSAIFGAALATGLTVDWFRA